MKRQGKSHSDTIRIINLPEKVPDKVIAYELDREFKKNFEVKSVRIHGGQFSRKFALVKFGTSQDAVAALEAKQGRMVAGFRLEMLLWDPIGPPLRKESYQYRTFAASRGSYHPPYGYWQEGMDPGASRCLFVGNVHKGTHPEEMDDVFRKYGQILSVDIKDNTSGSSATYAFVQMFNLNSACYAKKVLNGKFIGRNRCKVAFGKGTICSNVWIDGLDPTLTNLEVKEEFARFGEVIAIAFDRRCGAAIIQFGNRDAATQVFKRMRGKSIGRNKVLVDYASQECKDLFYEHLKKVEKEKTIKRSASFEDRPKSSRSYPPAPRHSSYRKFKELEEPDEYSKELQEFSKFQKRESFHRKKERTDENWQTVDEASSSGEETPEGRRGRRSRNKKKRSKKVHENSITPESGSSTGSESSENRRHKKVHRSRSRSRSRSPSPSYEKKVKYSAREKDISEDESPRLIRGKHEHSPFLNSAVKKQFSSDEELEEKKYVSTSPRSPPYIDNSKLEPMEVSYSRKGKASPPYQDEDLGMPLALHILSAVSVHGFPVESSSRRKSDTRPSKRLGPGVAEVEMTKSKRKKARDDSAEFEDHKRPISRDREDRDKKRRKEPNTPSPPPQMQSRGSDPGSKEQGGDQQMYASATQQQQQQQTQALMDLLRRYPVMWQGHLCLKNDSAAVQMHFLAGTLKLAEYALPQSQVSQPPPSLRISQRMRLDATQLDGVEKRLDKQSDYCLLLALPCGRDPLDVHHQTKTLRECFIKYLNTKDAAGILNVGNYVVHIFPPCSFSEKHLKVAAPDLLSSAADSGHLMILIVLTSKT